jgi:histone acetyltransferase (RNA polymerase elongator complex component)
MRPLIIPVFLPHAGCSEQCLFCNQKATARTIPSPSEVQAFVETALRSFPPSGGKRRQVAFYGGSFTAIPRRDQAAYLGTLRPFLASGSVDSIRVSTRPDRLEEEDLDLLKTFRVQTVEVGTQSLEDKVLSLSRRGHAAEDTLKAVSRLKALGFEVGIHLMIGLPGDSREGFLETLDLVIGLRPDFVRIHPTLVLRGAPLETLWRSGEYSPLPLNEAIQWLQQGILKLEKAALPVARLGLQASKELESFCLAGPYHPALRHLVDSEIYYEMAVRLLRDHPAGEMATFHCHPREASNLRGQGNRNILRLREGFGLKEIRIDTGMEIPAGSLFLQTRTGQAGMERKDLI